MRAGQIDTMMAVGAVIRTIGILLLVCTAVYPALGVIGGVLIAVGLGLRLLAWAERRSTTPEPPQDGSTGTVSPEK